MLTHSNGLVKVVLFAAVVTLCVVSTEEERVGLYEDTDLVEILDSSNFHEKLYKSNTSYVIEFYNAYCGHCIKFTVPWKKFALEVYGKNLYEIIIIHFHIINIAYSIILSEIVNFCIGHRY